MKADKTWWMPHADLCIQCGLLPEGLFCHHEDHEMLYSALIHCPFHFDTNII